MASLASKLRARIAQREIIVAPGIYDAFSAYRAEVAGFEAVFASGSALAATHLARPDIGLLSATETAAIVSRITERVSIPVLVDADQGFGNRFDVARTVKLFERAGAAAIQIEDQREVKASSAPLSRPLISARDMADKIKSARDALVDQDIMISARTDAMSSEGLETALERAQAYSEAGADIIFVESLTERNQMEKLVEQFGDTKPLLHNFLRPTDAVRDAKTAEEIGYSVALFPGTALGAVGDALDESFAELKSSPKVSKNAKSVDRIGADEFLN